MSHPKFTPGPWNIHPAHDPNRIMTCSATPDHPAFECATGIVAKGEQILGRIQYKRMLNNEPWGWPQVEDLSEMQANLALIVRAPELLAQVELLRETLSSIAAFAPGNGDVCEIIAKRARAALAATDPAEIPQEQA